MGSQTSGPGFGVHGVEFTGSFGWEFGIKSLHHQPLDLNPELMNESLNPKPEPPSSDWLNSGDFQAGGFPSYSPKQQFWEHPKKGNLECLEFTVLGL